MAKQSAGKTDTKEAIRSSLMILFLLRSDTSFTVKQIHQKLEDQGVELSERTVYNRLNKLCNDFPQHIKLIKGMPNGYRRPTNMQKNSFMTPSEAIAITLADKYLDSILPKFTKNMSLYLDEAEAVLNDTYSKKYKEWRSKVHFSNEQFSLMPAKSDPEVLLQIHLGILENKDLHINYFSRKKNKNINLNIVPVGVAYRGRLTYILGYFYEGDMCWLPINRINRCKIGDRIIDQHKYQLKDFENEKILEFSYNKKINLKLKFNKKAGHIFTETPISPKQKITEKANYLIIEDEVIFTEGLVFWLSSFADNVEVMQPKFLRQRIIDAVKSTLEIYES